MTMKYWDIPVGTFFRSSRQDTPDAIYLMLDGDEANSNLRRVVKVVPQYRGECRMSWTITMRADYPDWPDYKPLELEI
jgi:hypothetical protein